MDKRKQIEIILRIIIIFLVSFLLLSLLNGAVTIHMAIGGLTFTYIILHYWEKRYLKQKQLKQQKTAKVK
jgi:O-antigen/teichoic acid export membrane protein